MTVTLNLAVFLLLASSTINAETIYKSIDENGKVTYSTTPPKNATQSKSIDIAPPPSGEAIKAAQQRHERSKEAADILDENRKKRDAIIAEENRLKREQKIQLQLQRQAEKNNENENDAYPYVPRRRPGGILPPVHKPVHRPVQLPAR